MLSPHVGAHRSPQASSGPRLPPNTAAAPERRRLQLPYVVVQRWVLRCLSGESLDCRACSFARLVAQSL